MTTERLVIEVSERGTPVVKRNLADVGGTARKAGDGVKYLQRALGLLGAAAVLKTTISLSDAYTQLQNRLRVVTNGQEELAFATQELYDVSQRTRSSFESTVEMYSRMSIASRELGVSQREVLQFTESLNQAVILSGASASEASAGLIQLSQGLASGALRGDELRSVLEQLPAVADVIAKSLGVTRGQLRQMGMDGKITAKIVMDAFKEARVELAERFAKTVPTVGQAMIVAKNAIVKYVGEKNEAIGVTRTFSQSLIFLAGNIDVVARSLATVAATAAVVKLAPLASKAWLAAKAFFELRSAVLAGNVVMLGSLAAERAKAAHVLENAAAEAARTATVVASAQAEAARQAVKIQAIKSEMRHALVTKDATVAEFARIAVLKQITAMEAQHAIALEAVTAAQAQNTAALKGVTAAQAGVAASAKGSIPLVGGLVTKLRGLIAATGWIGVIVAAVAGLIAAFVIWGDKIKLAADHTASLKDVFRVLLSYLSPVWDWLKKIGSWTGGKLADAWKAVFGNISFSLLTFMSFFAAGLDFIVGSFVGSYQAIKVSWSGLPDALGDAFTQAMNKAIAVTETGINALVGGLNWLRDQVGLDQIADVTLGRLVNKSEGAAKELGERVRDAATKGITDTNIFGSWLENLIAKADALGAKRRAAEEAGGNGKPDVDPRAYTDYLRKLQQEGTLLGYSNKERKIQEGLLAAQKEFQDKLSVSQLAQVEAQLRQNQFIADQSALLEQIRGPMNAYREGQAALESLLRSGSINFEEYNRMLREFRDAAYPAEAAHMKLVQSIEREIELLRTPLPRRDIESQVQQANLAAPGGLNNEQQDELRMKLQELDLMKRETELLDGLRGPQLEYNLNKQALQALLAEGSISAKEYNSELQRLKDSLSDTKEVTVASQAIGALWNNSLDALDEFATTGKLVFSDFANSVIRDIQKIIQQQILLMAFRAVGIPVPGFASGGSFVVGGSGGTDSQFVAFRATPGEQVDISTPQQARRDSSSSSGSSGPVSVTIINVLDPDLVTEAIASQPGQEAIVNVIGRNRSAINQELSS